MDFIMQMQPWFGEEEKKAICEYMDENGFITEFKRTEKFEQMLAEYTGSNLLPSASTSSKNSLKLYLMILSIASTLLKLFWKVANGSIA